MILAETRRLLIRSWKPADIESYAKIVANPAVMQFIGKGEVQSYDDAENYIRECQAHFSSHGWSRFAVECRETQTLAGFCGFKHYNGELDFGWRYAPEFWNRGIGTEAARAVLDLGIKVFKFPRIVCIAYEENKASIRIIEKLGLKFEKNLTLNGKKVLQYVFVAGD